jgi:hypothetical protein
MVRTCGACGKQGHDSRSCPTLAKQLPLKVARKARILELVQAIKGGSQLQLKGVPFASSSKSKKKRGVPGFNTQGSGAKGRSAADKKRSNKLKREKYKLRVPRPLRKSFWEALVA